MKSLTFIIPTYNAERHLDTCLKSIRCQSYPQDRVEILILDGGSKDATRGIAHEYKAKILTNEKRLAEYGVQIGMREATGDYLAVFAADNELVGNDWIEKVISVFEEDANISAVWGRLVSGKNDVALNRYFELIQSDPLNWFLNGNLEKYLRKAWPNAVGGLVFRVDPRAPLVWGANGLVYRKERIKPIWVTEGYLGDNDAFQGMVERGDGKVCYFKTPFVIHHHVATLKDWIRKWRRNLGQHLVDKRETRNMGWVFTENFRGKLVWWGLYNLLPVLSIGHSLYLICRDRNIYWMYHPLVSLMQFFTYVGFVVGDSKTRTFIKDILWNR